MGNEHRHDDWLGTTMRQAPTSAPDACVDAETLAAWAAGGLRGQAAAAVELHASSCSRCMATLAAIERSAPELTTGAAWTPARLFRWLAPLAAAATAVAIWVVVPDRPMPRVEPAAAHDPAVLQPGALNREPGTVKPEPRTPDLAPSIRNPEPQAQAAPSARLEKPAVREELMRDERRSDRAAQEAPGTVAGAAPTPAPPPAVTESARAAAPPAASPADAAATQTLNESIVVAPQQRSAFMGTTAVTSEAISPVNQLVRWRVIDSAAVERSTDGGKTWTRTAQISDAGPSKPDALVIRSIRAVDDVTAIARTSDGRDFVTSNGGRSWIPAVQEKPAAPF